MILTCWPMVIPRFFKAFTIRVYPPFTWGKLIHNYGWKRSKKRIYPPKLKIGIRAIRPNQYWHVDVSVLRLPNNEKLFIHAIIDNFSRKIMSWRIFDHLSAEEIR